METKFVYLPKGTCSVKMTFTLDDDIIKDFEVVGGCNGNLKGIRSLIIGMKAEDVIAKLKGIKCGYKSTSCPDQLSIGLEEYLSSKKESK
jgi:uncharacterized protein (TIGR03905 family)